MRRRSFSIISLGCFRNTYDSEIVAKRYVDKGYMLKEKAEKVDLLIINTCGFIKEAKEESIEAIEAAIDWKRKNKVGEILVKGCLVERYRDKLERYFPEVDKWEGVEDFPKKFVEREKLTPFYIDFLKICEGCANKCSYCAIPQIKGTLKSRPVEEIIKEAKELDKKGVKELNIIGQDITSWGKDLPFNYEKSPFKGKDLVYLLKKILKETKNIPWIRLLYTHPKNFSDSLLDLIANEERICKYVDLPIQHINNRILKYMNRQTTKEEIISLIEKIRKKVPEVCIRTSIIVGFPGETEDEFKELVKFITEVKFERLGAFIYSPEENTPAYNLKGRVHYKTKKRRYDELMRIQREISHQVNKKFLDKKLAVLVEEETDGFFIGRTEFSAYQIDGEVFLKRKNLKIGDFYEAKIIEALEYDLIGE